MGPQPERLAKWTGHLVKPDKNEKYLFVGFIQEDVFWTQTPVTWSLKFCLFVFCLGCVYISTCVLVSMHMCEGTPEYRNQRFLYLYQISLGHSLPYFLVKILYHFSLSSIQTLPCTSSFCLPSKWWPLFFVIVMHMCVHVYMYIYI